jgi:hypothetical protein
LQGRSLEAHHPRGLRREQGRSQEAPSYQERPACSLEPPRSCQARVVGCLQEARSCQALAEGSQVRPMRLQGRRRRWRYRRRRQIHPPDLLTYPRDQTHAAARALKLHRPGNARLGQVCLSRSTVICDHDFFSMSLCFSFLWFFP